MNGPFRAALLLAAAAACHPAPRRADQRSDAPGAEQSATPAAATEQAATPGTEQSATLAPAAEQPAEGVALFYVSEGRVRRADCASRAPATAAAADTPATAAAVAAQCKDLPGAAEAPTLAAFEAALTTAYEQRVGDDAVNDREARAIHQVVYGLLGAPEDAALTDAPAGAAAALAEARAAALLDAAFDGKNAALAVAAGEPPSGLDLADAPTYELARARLDAGKVAVGTSTYALNLTPAAAVSTLAVRVAAAAGSTCPLTLKALTRVWVRKADADVEIPVAADAARPGTYTINAGAAVKPTRAYVSVRRAAPTPAAGTCLVIVEGRPPVAAPAPVDSPRDAKMKALMGTRAHRLYHFMWHGIRNAWPEMTASERKQIKDRLGAAWTRSAAETTKKPQADKGEEFFHMHRHMVAAVKALLGAAMYPAWPAPPAPDSRDFPLPAGNTAASAKEYTDVILPLHKSAIDPAFLRSRSLGDYGDWLETGLHNALHNRFADPRKASLEQMSEIFQTPQAAWDLPNADYLGSTYSAHVNPLFYGLHGYVDARIDDWLRANNYDTIADQCAGAPRCYQWKRVWDGPAPDHGGLALAEHQAEDHFSELPRSLQRLVQESSTFLFQP